MLRPAGVSLCAEAGGFRRKCGDLPEILPELSSEEIKTNGYFSEKVPIGFKKVLTSVSQCDILNADESYCDTSN